MAKLPNMGGLERSCAFTALLDNSPAFARADDRDGSIVTRFLNDYAGWLNDRAVKMGKTDIYTFSKFWAKQHPNL